MRLALALVCLALLPAASASELLVVANGESWGAAALTLEDPDGYATQGTRAGWVPLCHAQDSVPLKATYWPVPLRSGSSLRGAFATTLAPPAFGPEPPTVHWLVETVLAGAPSALPAPRVRVDAQLVDALDPLTPVVHARGSTTADLAGASSAGATHEAIDGRHVYAIDIPLAWQDGSQRMPAQPALLVDFGVDAPACGDATLPTLAHFSIPGHRPRLAFTAEGGPVAFEAGLAGRGPATPASTEHPQAVWTVPAGEARDLTFLAVVASNWGPVGVDNVTLDVRGAGTASVASLSQQHPIHTHGDVSSYVRQEAGIRAWSLSLPKPGTYNLTLRADATLGTPLAQSWTLEVQPDRDAGTPGAQPLAGLAAMGAALLAARRSR